MKRLCLFIILILATWPLIQAAQAQSPTPTPELENPFSRELEESDTNPPPLDSSPDQVRADELLYNLSGLDSEADKLQATLGFIDDQGNYQSGSLGRLKLKPSDKKRLTKLANGSLNEKEKEAVIYDQRLLDLLVQLTTPTELGGGGLEHLRVGDLLRFRNDPRSRETEGTDNISQHQYGKAADIIEINTTHCTKKSFLRKKDLASFPVKVAWQGGGPYNPAITSPASFDAVARSNALRDILGTLPTDSYDGSFQGFADLLQQLQRRVLAQEAGVDRGSLDILINNDTLETLGRALVNNNLGYAPGAFVGTSPDEVTRSIPQSFLEQSLHLPPTALKGDDWNQSLERLGRFKVAIDNDIDPAEIVAGSLDKLRSSPYYRAYKQAEQAYRLPSGTLAGAEQNRPEAFRKIGALVIADTLRYPPSERDELIAQADQGKVTQLSLARFGDIKDFPGNALLVMAPGPQSSKAAAERYLAKEMLNGKTAITSDSLPDAIVHALSTTIPGLHTTRSRSAVTKDLITSPKLREAFRQAGAGAMEEAFGLPEQSLSHLVTATSTPSLDQFRTYLGQRLIEDYETATVGAFNATPHLRHTAAESDTHFGLPKGTTERFLSRQIGAADFKTLVGQAYLDTTFQDSFHDLYHTPSNGLAALSVGDMFSLLVGTVNAAASRAGASWVEEDLGLVPDSFAVLFNQADPEELLVNAGIAVLGGELFNAFEVDGREVKDGLTLKRRLGAAAIETTLGLNPGSFQTSVQIVKNLNAERFSTVFSHPNQVDTGLRLPSGTTQQFLDGKLPPSSVAEQVGLAPLGQLNSEELQNRLGWNGDYLIDGEQLLRTIDSSNGTTTDKKSGQTITMRSLLARIGGYNLDQSFGYDPGTMEAWAHASSAEEQNSILLKQGGELYGDRLGLSLENRDDLVRAYREGGDTRIGTKASSRTLRTALEEKIKERFALPSGTISEQDALSFVTGDMRLANAVVAAVNQTNQVKVDLEEKYELFRTIAAGWSNEPSFETMLATKEGDRYKRILADYAQTKANDLLDPVLDRVTQGVLTANQIFNAAQSPYPGPLLEKIKSGYFATKEAQNTFFYGLLDAQIQKKNGSVPPDFTETLVLGSNTERSAMLYTFLGSKVSDGILTSLPPDVRTLATTWFNHYDPETGKILNQNAIFTDWASATISQYTDNAISSTAMKFALNYLNGTINPAAIQENPALIIDLSPGNLVNLVNSQLGLPTGQFGEFYSKYKQMQQLYTKYKAGSLDASEAAFAVDAILFDGALAELVRGLDDLLGLPPGSVQELIQFALSGNPVHLFKFIYNIFFGSWIDCPDLQQEAQKNVQLLIRKILELGQDSARLIPSQIITFKQSYITALSDKIKQNYSLCLELPGARCGVFARPEYSTQVHIGF